MPPLPEDWPRAFSNPAVALWRMSASFAASVALLTAYLAIGVGKRDKKAQYAHAIKWSQTWARTLCRVSGIKIIVAGEPPQPGSLIASNHISHTDIPSLLCGTGCFFVPKAELGSWPVIGSFIRLARQPLVQRTRSRGMKATAAEVEDRLRCGESVCVFLEGTTTGGDRILPFQPSFLQPAINAGAPIVPAAITYRSSDPKVDAMEDLGYWRAEHTFVPHLWRALGLRGLEVEIRFGEPIPTAGQDRKELAVAARREALRLKGLPDLLGAPDEPDAEPDAESA